MSPGPLATILDVVDSRSLRMRGAVWTICAVWIVEFDGLGEEADGR